MLWADDELYSKIEMNKTNKYLIFTAKPPTALQNQSLTQRNAQNNHIYCLILTVTRMLKVNPQFAVQKQGGYKASLFE